jgi:hypothetical protein
MTTEGHRTARASAKAAPSNPPFPWCTICNAIQRKPIGGQSCPVCKHAVLSTEQLNEPNHLLYRQWRAVFRSILGFEHCVCLRRVRCPNKAGDMDFLLIEPGSDPKLGLVETEGWSFLRSRPMAVPKGLVQVEAYLKAFRRYRGQGETLLHVSIDNAFDRQNLRGRTNLAHWKARARWMGALRGIGSRADLERLLGRVSRRNMVPILLYFRDPRAANPALTPALTPEEEQTLAERCTSPRLFAGTVSWPLGDRLLSGRYL